MSGTRCRRSRILAAPAAFVALVATFSPVPVAIAAEPVEPVERVLILSLPHVTWSDIEETSTPNLDRLMDQSALANLTVRVERRATRVGDGYATLGTGTRAVAPDAIAGLAFEAGERYDGATAAESYERRTGEKPAGHLVHVAVPAVRRANDSALFGGDLGRLGATLAEAGVPRAVIGNADSGLTGDTDATLFHREVVLGLADEDGLVPAGRIDRGLLAAAPLAPFGVMLHPDVVQEAFAEVWPAGGVVLVEASDLARAERFAPLATSDAADFHRRRALEAADRLAGSLLKEVNDDRDAVVVVAPASPSNDPHLTVLAVRAPSGRPGLLSSASTRQDGYVVLADVAPTVVDLLGIPRPDEMEGRPAVVEDIGGSLESRVETLVDANAAARFRDRALGPVAATFIALVVILLLITAAGLGAQRRVRGAIEVGSLSLLAMLPLTYISALLPASAGPLAYGLLVGGGSMAVGLGAWAFRRQPLVPIGLVLSVMVGTILLSVIVLGSRLQMSTVFGDSPIVGGRFSGVNNVTFAQLVVGGLVLAGLAAHWVSGRRGRYLATAVMVVVLAAIAAPMWGADVGGILAGVPAFGLAAMLLWDRRVRLRNVVVAGVVTVAVALALGGLDLLRPEDERSHLGRLLEQVGAEGWEGLETVVVRKLAANFATLTSSVWAILLPPTFAFAGWLAWRAQDRMRRVGSRVPELQPAAAGILVAGVLGWALNDSGVAVPGMMLAVVGPVLAYLLMRLTPAG